MRRRTRVLIVDDHAMIRRGLRSVLGTRDDMELCAEAENGRDAVALAAELRPDVVIMDLTMPILNGLDATRRILKDCPNTEVVILTMHDSEQLLHEVLATGAKGCVLKSDAGHAIVDAVLSVRNHKPYFTSSMAQVLLNTYRAPHARTAAPAAPDTALTAREREVVQLIAEGRSSKEVAAALGISEKTAETHRANLMRKLDVHSVSEIVRYAIRNRMIEP